MDRRRAGDRPVSACVHPGLARSIRRETGRAVKWTEAPASVRDMWTGVCAGEKAGKRRTSGMAGERIDGQMDGWTGGQVSRRAGEPAGGQVDLCERTTRWAGERMDGRREGRGGERVGEWASRLADSQITNSRRKLNRRAAWCAAGQAGVRAAGLVRGRTDWCVGE